MIKLTDILNELGINNPNITKQTIHDRIQIGYYGDISLRSNPLLKRDLKALGSIKNGDLYTFNVKLNPYKKGKYHLESKTTLDLYNDNRISIKKIKQILDILEIPYNKCNVYEGYKILGYYNYPEFVSIVCYYHNNIIMFSEMSISQDTYWKILTTEKTLKLVDIDFANNKTKQNNKLYYKGIIKQILDFDKREIIIEQSTSTEIINISNLSFDVTKEPYIYHYGNDPHTLIRFNNVVGNIHLMLTNGENVSIPINQKTNKFGQDEFWDLGDNRTNFSVFMEIDKYIKNLNKINAKSIQPNQYSKTDLENILF